jgi:hypothetical protein
VTKTARTAPGPPLPHPEPVPVDAARWCLGGAEFCLFCPALAQVLFVRVGLDEEELIVDRAGSVWTEVPVITSLYLCAHHATELEARVLRWDRPQPGSLRAAHRSPAPWQCVLDCRLGLRASEAGPR